jgi:hypothetical protein
MRPAPYAGIGGRRALGAQPRIDNVVEQVDAGIDDHENQGHEHQICRHHWHVGKVHRLDEQRSHARPLEDSLGYDRKGDQTAKLKTEDRDDGY